jgi:hypothetical protein
MFLIKVTIGAGRNKVSKELTLPACPHTGDQINVDGVVVTCERVCISPDHVTVQELLPFTDSTVREYVELGWKTA